MYQILATVQYSSVGDVLGDIIRSFIWRDALDIIIASFLIYLILIFIKQTRSYFIFSSLIFLFIVSYLSRAWDLGLTRQLLDPIITFFFIIFVIVFQREIRRFIRWFALLRNRMSYDSTEMDLDFPSILVKAVQDMAKKKMGALLVLAGEYPLEDIVEGGFELNGKISVPLLLSIFDNHTPGHDGAVIVENGQIKRFAVHLPLAEDFKGFSTMGTRHRAGIGISERTDALVIIVSEERGTISVAENGKIRTLSGAGELDDVIRVYLNESSVQENSFLRYITLHHFVSKITAVFLALILWFVFVLQAGVVNKDFVVPIEFTKLPAGITVTQAYPSQANVTFSGLNRDIQSITANDVKIRINMDNATSGISVINLDSSKVNYPPYLSLVKLSPSSVKITLTADKASN